MQRGPELFISSFYCTVSWEQEECYRHLMDVPLRTRKALSLYKVYCYSTLLVLNGTSLNSINTLLALSRQYVPINALKSVHVSSCCIQKVHIHMICIKYTLSYSRPICFSSSYLHSQFPYSFSISCTQTFSVQPEWCWKFDHNSTCLLESFTNLPILISKASDILHSTYSFVHSFLMMTLSEWNPPEGLVIKNVLFWKVLLTSSPPSEVSISSVGLALFVKIMFPFDHTALKVQRENETKNW